MRLYYITTLGRACDIKQDWHGIELLDADGKPNGKWMIAVRWKDEGEEMHWSNHPEVIALPHPLLESAAKLEDQHVVHLGAHLGVSKTSTVLDAIKAAGKLHPNMRLHVL